LPGPGGNSGDDSEKIIGSWIKSRGTRDKLLIATKVGGELLEGENGLSRRHIRNAVEASLQRLQTDHIDLYQAHYDRPRTTKAAVFALPQREQGATLSELIAALSSPRKAEIDETFCLKVLR
jgi:aryl-alcohol dehydrogenase-like predicted oxidoreductase